MIFKPWANGVAEAAGQATLVAVVWLTFIHWAGQLYRAMTFAVGAFAVAAVASFAGVAAVSPRSPTGCRGSASSTSRWCSSASQRFFFIGSWDYFVRLAARAPRRVLVVGAGAATAELLDDLAREPEAELDVVAIVDDEIDESLRERVAHHGAAQEPRLDDPAASHPTSW